MSGSAAVVSEQGGCRHWDDVTEERDPGLEGGRMRLSVSIETRPSRRDRGKDDGPREVFKCRPRAPGSSGNPLRHSP